MSGRTRTTRLGELLRAARAAIESEQADFAKANFTSKRTISRWENGAAMPPPEKRARLVTSLVDAEAPRDLVAAIAAELGVALPGQAEAVATPAVAQPPPSPSHVEHQALLDAVVYAAADERDVLPRHLRAFAVQLLMAVHRAGMSPMAAAALIASKGEKRQAGPSDPGSHSL